MDVQKLAKLQQQVRIGGKGSVRRKHKAVHKNAATDDKKIQAAIKRLGVNQIPGIEEVNLFKEDGKIIHFANPKLQAAPNSNTYVITGPSEEKSMEQLMPGILQQMGSDLGSLQRFAAQMKGQGKAGGGAAGAAADDDDVPALVENFDAVAKNPAAGAAAPAAAGTTTAGNKPTPVTSVD